MVDLRKEFTKLIDEYGSDYLLVRSNKKRPCKCIDTLYNSAKKDCPICLGTGFINKVERVHARETLSAMPVLLPRIGELAEPGNIVVPAKDFYLEYPIRPERQDLIVVCQWNGLRPIFDEYTGIYKVTYVQPMNGDGGRIEYFIASTEGQPIKAQAILHNISANAQRIDYYITVR